MRRAHPILAILAAGLAAAGLSSCSPSAVLVVGPSSPPLRQELTRLAAGYSRSHGLRIKPAEKRATRGATIAIDWSFVLSKGEPGLSAISAESARKAGFETALAFEGWEEGDGGWREIPILWDAWGAASMPDRRAVPRGDKTFEWKDRGSLIRAKQTILLPGDEAGVWQSLFWSSKAQLPEQGLLIGMLLGGDARSGPVGRGYFQSLAAMGGDPTFSLGSLGMMRADVENLARNSKINQLFGNYEWLRAVPGSAHRDFRALVYPLPQGYAMPVSILAGKVLGSGAAAAKAREFLLWLASRENEKELSDRTGYMAANFNATNLDLDALGARDAAIKAARIVPIDPEPPRGSAAASWDSLLGRVVAAPTEWERAIAEKEGR
jgi:hypothetical protein